MNMELLYFELIMRKIMLFVLIEKQVRKTCLPVEGNHVCTERGCRKCTKNNPNNNALILVSLQSMNTDDYICTNVPN